MIDSRHLIPESGETWARAEAIYRDTLKSLLEATRPHEFVAIEPTSGDYFIGASPGDATALARQHYPDRPCGLIEIGANTAFGVDLTSSPHEDILRDAAVSRGSSDLARRSKAIYEQRWRTVYEAQALHHFLAIEPDSETCFLGATLGEAIDAARAAHPGKLVFGLRVGHAAAIHIGAVP